jgi:hypothetical protein
MSSPGSIAAKRIAISFVRGREVPFEVRNFKGRKSRSLSRSNDSEP